VAEVHSRIWATKEGLYFNRGDGASIDQNRRKWERKLRFKGPAGGYFLDKKGNGKKNPKGELRNHPNPGQGTIPALHDTGLVKKRPKDLWLGMVNRDPLTRCGHISLSPHGHSDRVHFSAITRKHYPSHGAPMKRAHGGPELNGKITPFPTGKGPQKTRNLPSSELYTVTEGTKVGWNDGGLAGSVSERGGRGL